MILACHTLIFSDDADATRAFFSDVLGFANVDAGTGDDNWLIFRTGPSELGVHLAAATGCGVRCFIVRAHFPVVRRG